jgi:catechol 2,3-dioxygenase-like lactoylglutathione lyase family enzyme
MNPADLPASTPAEAVMIHHLAVGSNDVARAKAFYDPVLAVLGMRTMQESERAVDYGVSSLLFSVETPVENGPATVSNGSHVAFAAEDRAMVNAFHQAALANGGTDAGKPGLRPQYDAHYYGAFVRDPDGNKLEAVTFSAE